ncbi:hypothetical protein KVV02_004764 [Mortierella alpina]|uniref:FAD-binding domain-containing protein n=1 Tax=Mortierella alpina TaxID=64518 RepID=A0A9P8AAF4_MORAP|nr:hypothetical protein KVV02_004764 [Mortierella alpina]
MSTPRRHKNRPSKQHPTPYASTPRKSTRNPHDRSSNQLLFRHRVLIVGGNIQGLILGLILQRLGINYLILERSCRYGISSGTTVIGSFALNLFEMLGIVDQIKSVSTELHRMKIWTENGAPQAEADFTGAEARYSHNGIIVSCRVLQDLLRAQIPTNRVVDGKELAQYEQDLDEVRVTCTDGSVFRGVILVGCDGHQSSVRKLLHEEQDVRLSAADRAQLSGTCNVIGATRPLHGSTLLDPDTLQSVFDLDYGNNQVVFGQSTPYSCWLLPMPNEPRISWMITYNRPPNGAPSFFDGDGLEPDSRHRENLEQVFLDQVRQAILLDQTDPEDMRKVPNEGRFYDMWYSGRVVLAGDACHALVPGGGQGILQAMLDAYSLAPLIKHALLAGEDATGETQLEHITLAFEGYYRERHDIARNAVVGSENLGRLFSQQPPPPSSSSVSSSAPLQEQQQQQQQPPPSSSSGQSEVLNITQSFHFDFAFDFFPAWLQQYAERGNMALGDGEDDDSEDHSD